MLTKVKALLLSAIFFPLSAAVLLFSFYYLLYTNKIHSVLAGQSNPSSGNLLGIQIFPTYIPEIKTPNKDIRVLVLENFLREYKSPLVPHAQELVKQADIYGLDYALLPAIAMQESGACKTIPQGSYNCWGFGVYGSNVVRFNSYEEAITKVAKTIKESYIKNGLTNATLVEDRWTPSSRGNWSYSVNYYIGKIREFERKTASS